jgi:hypothetical protein
MVEFVREMALIFPFKRKNNSGGLTFTKVKVLKGKPNDITSKIEENRVTD